MTSVHTTPVPLRVLAVPAVIVVLLAGLWFFSSVVFHSYYGSIVAGAVWFIVAGVTMSRLSKRRPDLRPWVRGAVVLTSLTAAFLFYWTSIRETTVNEQVVTGTPASDLALRAPATGHPDRPARPTGPVQVYKGDVESLAHSGDGRAAIVRLPDGDRKLTLTKFDIDPGPQVVVRLATSGSDGASYKGLGDLKGTKGNQQYGVSKSIDLRKYDTVIFWCVPFNQALAKADLRPS